MASLPSRDQTQDAQKLYDDRAVHYDDSWHPRFARHIVELAKISRGEHVLDLACGTGLVSYPASVAVGETGSVTGVDISSGMLAQAHAKKTGHHANVQFFQHSITDLATLAEVQGKQFDVITCASALVLLEQAGEAIKHWTNYLRPGGRLITDVTHPDSQISLITFERVGRALGRPLPYYRVPFQGPADLEKLMKDGGLQKVEVVFMSQMDIGGRDDLESYRNDLEHPRIENTYSIADADRLFDKHIGHWVAATLASPDVKAEARKVFKEEWTKLADAEGMINEVDGVFVGIGAKPE